MRMCHNWLCSPCIQGGRNLVTSSALAHGVTCSAHGVTCSDVRSCSGLLARCGQCRASGLSGTYAGSTRLQSGTLAQVMSDPSSRSEEVAMYYQWFLDVEVMIFLGFGFLMTFLRRYSYSAVAFNFFISAFVMIYSVLVIGFVQQVTHQKALHTQCWPPHLSLLAVLCCLQQKEIPEIRPSATPTSTPDLLVVRH